MELSTIAGLSEFLAAIIAAIAIVVSLKGIRDQLRLSMFAEYTRRFAEIVDDLPYEARRPGSDYCLSVLPRIGSTSY
jgi:hypothetical protein